MTLAEALSDFIVERKLGASSARAYRSALKRLGSVHGSPRTINDLGALRPLTMNELVKSAEALKWSPATTRLTFHVLKQLHRWALRNELVTNDPFAGGLNTTRVGNNVPEWNVLAKGELDQLIEHLKTERAAHWRSHVALLLLCARQGLRIHEALGLSWDQVRESSEGKPYVTFIGKGGKPARMGLRPEVFKAMRAAKVPNPNPTMYVVQTPRTTSGAWRLVSGLTQSVLGHRVTPHGLRATFISEVIAARGIEVGRQAARHSSITTTQRYSRWTFEDPESWE